ncbi:MAG: M1 family metallopeptidase [Clostridia bacterium]|nr:M1 family metallopeptidase [Clostridia bacterium]
MKKLFCLFLSVFILCTAVTFVGCTPKQSLCKYTIAAEYAPDTGTLTADMNFNYVNTTENEISVLKFNLFPNAFREGATYEPVSSVYRSVAYYDGESYGNISITEVTGAESWEVCGEDENILSVTLTQSLFPEERAEINIKFTVTLAKINHRTGITENVINVGNFYPVLCVYDQPNGYYECVYYSDGDPFYSACADYDVYLTVPAGYTVAASALGKTSQKEGKVTYRYVLSSARDFAFALSNRFEVCSKEVNGIPVTYYYYDDAEAQSTLQTACDAFSYFSEAFGEYVYDSYALVQTGFCYGGMEYPGMVLLSDALERENYLYTVVHETAHQWWYAAVGSNQQEYAWMDEGLSEYSTLLFYETHESYGLTRESIVHTALTKYKAYYSIYNQIFGESNTSMNRNLSTYVSEYEYVNLTYNKGLLLFDALREGIGDNRFFAGLKNYYAEYTHQIATPEDMISCFKKTGVDVEGLFDSFLSGTAVI